MQQEQLVTNKIIFEDHFHKVKEEELKQEIDEFINEAKTDKSSKTGHK